MEGPWRQQSKQLVSEFETEFLARLTELSQAVERDGLTKAEVFPPVRDTHLCFIGQIKSSIREEAHALLTSRQANGLVGADLAYAQGHFEKLEYEHLLKLFLEVEAITLQREAVKARNVGTAPAPGTSKVPEGQRGHRDRNADQSGRPAKDRNSWQRSAAQREVHSNAKVTSTGEVAELQSTLGTYVNSTGDYVLHKGVWASPCTPSARGVCSRCSKDHFIDVPCGGGSPNVVMPMEKRHSKCTRPMARDMDAGQYKRLTHRFQGGTEGYPKASSKEGDKRSAVRAAAVVAAAAVTTPSGKKKTKQGGTAAKRKTAQSAAAAAKAAAKAAAAAADAQDASDTDGSERGDDDDDDQDGELALTTATRATTNATGALGHTHLASRQRRLGRRSTLSPAATSAVISVTTDPSTLTLGHGTAPLQSGVVQQEAGQAELTSVAHGSIEQCDRPRIGHCCHHSQA